MPFIIVTVNYGQKRLHGFGAQSNSTEENVCEGKKYFEVLKNTNLDDCRRRPFFQKQNGIENNDCDPSQSACTDRYNVSQFAKKIAILGLFLVYFRLFKQTLQQIYVKICPSSIRYWDSNPQPSGHEPPPITTRPGLPPKFT